MKTIIEQMCLDAETIKEKMKEIVEEKINNPHLKDTLQTFINEKIILLLVFLHLSIMWLSMVSIIRILRY